MTRYKRTIEPAVRHRVPRSPGTTPEDVAAFAESHITELRDLAEGAGLSFLAYLLDLARIEALNAVARRQDRPLDHDDLGLTQPQVINVIDSSMSMMSPENRYTLFGIMLSQ